MEPDLQKEVMFLVRCILANRLVRVFYMHVLSISECAHSRASIQCLRKPLTKWQRLRLKLTSAGMVKKSINKDGKVVVSLDC